MEVLQGPDHAQMKAIAEELGEDLDRHQNNLQLLQSWISCQPHLPQDYAKSSGGNLQLNSIQSNLSVASFPENNMLSVFLRGCKHNLEKTKEKIQMYFIARSEVPELFCNRNPSTELLSKYNEMIKMAPLPKLTPAGERITIFKIESISGEDWNIKDVLRYVYITADLRVAEESPIAGDIFIYDLENLQASHMLKYVSPLLRKALIAANEAYPHRLKQLHLVNTPALAEKGLQITKNFLKEKIRKRFIVHDSVDGLLNYLPNNVLPREYGGTLGSYKEFVNNWTNSIMKRNKWFQQQDNVKAMGPIPDTSLQSHFDDIVGIQGSFRKLEID